LYGSFIDSSLMLELYALWFAYPFSSGFGLLTSAR